MTRQNAPWLLAFCIVLAPASKCSAELAVERKIAPQRQEAARLARARQYERAIAVLGDALQTVNIAMREHRPVRKTVSPLPKGYQEEVDQLLREMRQSQKAEGGARPSARVIQNYLSRRAALDRKYKIDRGGKQSGELARNRLVVEKAPYELLAATIGDQIADYQEARGAGVEAEALRVTAAVTRLRIYPVLNQHGDARFVAEQILARKPSDPAAYNAVGMFFMERSEWARAGAVWQQVIGLIESGKAKKPVSRPGAPPEKVHPQLEQFYRSLALCYHKQGKSADSNRVLKRAEELHQQATAAVAPSK
jgi:tetratricopeptide (TPR) repeat protein